MTRPAWSRVVVMASGPILTVSDSVLVAVWGVGVVLSVTWTVKVHVPAVVGLPVRTPVFAATFSHAGGAPEAIFHVYEGLHRWRSATLCSRRLVCHPVGRSW